MHNTRGQDMQGKPIFTPIWEENKKKFLSQHSFNGQVETCVKHIIDQIGREQPLTNGDKGDGYFIYETPLPGSSYGLLACICVMNKQTGDFAPAALYFPGIQRKLSMLPINEAFKQVKESLGW